VTAEPTAAPAATTGPPAPAATASDEEAPPPPSAEQKAFVTGPLLGTDVVFITVADATQTCASVASKASPPKGARRADLRVLWKSGYYDFSNRMAEAKLGTYQGTFWLKEDATQGGIQVRVAPTQQGSTGRIHVKATRPGSAQALDARMSSRRRRRGPTPDAPLLGAHPPSTTSPHSGIDPHSAEQLVQAQE
jgi:hypothetical protein